MFGFTLKNVFFACGDFKGHTETTEITEILACG